MGHEPIYCYRYKNMVGKYRRIKHILKLKFIQYERLHIVSALSFCC